MPFFDFSLDELKNYKPARNEPANFNTFWKNTLEETRKYPLNATFKPIDYGLSTVESYDVTFNGYNGQPIKGWLLLPRQKKEKLPCIVEYIGYGGGRAFPFDWLIWSSVGCAHFIMDTRGQGSAWAPGDTPDIQDLPANPSYPGFMTQGILNPDTYYYRRVFSDAVRAVEAARSHPAVDAARIGVTGGSQGGGITVAMSGLIPDLALVMPDVPFLCHYRRATEITDRNPYQEISLFLKTHRNQVENVFNTLSYFDGVNFSARANAKALFSAGLMDMICPPSTVFAAYNHYAGEKDIRIYSYNDHEGGASFQRFEQIKLVKETWNL